MLQSVMVLFKHIFRRIKSLFFIKNKEEEITDTPLVEIVAENTQTLSEEVPEDGKKKKKPRGKTEKAKSTKKPAVKKNQKRESKKPPVSKQKTRKKPVVVAPVPVSYIPQTVVDTPDKIANGNIYIVGENGYNWLAVFRCPCGCNEVIHLNLLKDADPSWSIKYQSDGTISISPSISRKVGCKSHFFIVRGQVEWR